ncbi:lipopolysaccharide biosynthesis protein [Agarivorans sp. QJM3NY_25]|uniref:lipopolysaccharide biosynthesis protein n=1 Tax=Agarivorans sp. QJM3NY_25 TaxID=3421430 RepID=UPI003D7DC31A
MLWNKLLALKQSTQEMGIYGLLMLLQKGAGLMMLPVTTHYLSLAEYGLLESLVVIFSLCSLLEISAGALPRFYPDCEDDAGRQRLLSSSVLLSLCYGLVLACLTVSLLAHLPFAIFDTLVTAQWCLIAAVITFSIGLQPLMIWLRIEMRAVSYFYLVICQTAAQVLITFWGLKHGWGIDSVLIASACANALGLAIGLGCCRAQLKLKLDFFLVKQTLTYQVCLIGASLSLFVMHGLDRLLLAEWLGSETLARYAIMIKVVEATALGFGIVESWWLPRRFKVLKKQNGPQQVLQIHQRLLLIIFSLLLLAMIFAPPLLPWVLPSDYLQGLIWLPLMLLALGFKLATSVTDIGCYLPNSPVWLPRINALAAVFALVLYYCLIPRWGVWGLVVASNLVFAARFILFTWVSLRLQPLAYPLARLLFSFIPPLFVFVLLPFVAGSLWFYLLPHLALFWLFVASTRLISLRARTLVCD